MLKNPASRHTTQRIKPTAIIYAVENAISPPFHQQLNSVQTMPKLEETDAPECRINRLNLLAFPRNQSPRCEITNERACVELVTPYITLYYLNEEFAEQAWHGIIKKIAHLLSPLMQSVPMVGTQEERNRRATNTVLSKRSLIEFCLVESANHLSSQRYQLAFPAALQALKFSKEIDGDKSISLVEPYLQLSQALLGLNQLNKAEEYLAMARWIVLNRNDCTDQIRSKLFLLKGRVCTAQGDFETAKADYAQAIYYASKCFGAESVVTSLGFFRIGDVFLAQGNMESALAYFDKVVDIWYKYLCELQNEGNLNDIAGSALRSRSAVQLVKEKDRLSSITADQLTEENLSEGRSHLEAIFEHRKRLLGSSHIATGEIQYTLGLFEFLLLNHEAIAENYIVAALQSYEMQLGSAHPSTKHVQAMLEIIQHTMSKRYDSETNY